MQDSFSFWKMGYWRMAGIIILAGQFHWADNGVVLAVHWREPVGFKGSRSTPKYPKNPPPPPSHRAPKKLRVFLRSCRLNGFTRSLGVLGFDRVREGIIHALLPVSIIHIL
jgi:hypothetical protein